MWLPKMEWIVSVFDRDDHDDENNDKNINDDDEDDNDEKGANYTAMWLPEME